MDNVAGRLTLDPIAVIEDWIGIDFKSCFLHRALGNRRIGARVPGGLAATEAEVMMMLDEQWVRYRH